MGQASRTMAAMALKRVHLGSDRLVAEETEDGLVLRVVADGVSGGGGGETAAVPDVAEVITVPVESAESVELSPAGVPTRTIYNDCEAVLYVLLGDGEASSTSFTIKMAADSYYEVPFGYVGAIQGIWESEASGNGAHVTTLTVSED